MRIEACEGMLLNMPVTVSFARDRFINMIQCKALS
jgi:hypothetical protein